MQDCLYAAVLAGGLSSRMRSSNANKVCMDLLGTPVICRTLNALRAGGVSNSVVVLGPHAAQVMECIAGAKLESLYAFQPRQGGTADALFHALAALPEAIKNTDALLLVTPGHRILAPEVLQKLRALYESSHAKTAEIVYQPAGGDAKPISVYLGKLGDFAEGVQAFRPAENREWNLDELALAMNGGNPGAILTVSDFSQVLGFANPAELMDVTEILRKQSGARAEAVDAAIFHPVSEWRAALAAESGALQKSLEALYGGDLDLLKREGSVMRQMLDWAHANWGDNAAAALVRSPGRVNVMGRHVDHQGGNCNLMTIGFETLMLARLRDDDHVTLHNLNPEFAPAEFSIGELVKDLPWDDWQTLVASEKLAKLLKQYGVNWSDYVKAVFLRFQKQFTDRKLRGMDVLVAGNVPMAAGLSSSSTLVVGGAELVVNANRLDLEADKLVTLCGEGEWFVGTRGGAADHAAVKLGACNKVVKVGFFDFKVEKLVDFPADYALIVADSGIKARKSSNAKDQFNHRVSCYRIGFLLLKKLYPEYAERLHHLRDFTPENLGVPLDWFYHLLAALPEKATRPELEAMLPGEDLSEFWRNHAEPEDKLYPVRGVVLYGLAECARSARYVDVLASGDMAAVGQLMKISHDGDRVMRFDADGKECGAYHSDTSDGALQRLSDALRSGDPARMEAAQLWRQPGSYRCSLPDIDRMVDLACGVPGVVGAQLAGAGLGGCMMSLVKLDAVEALKAKLTECYYKPAGREPKLLHCRPIAGAGVIRWEGTRYER